ncbi:siphovirus ReqiPepy6 Gp37-like family protein [Desemzia incerta]|uniref:siphovirus ReqiPepy6 Gp37-like family protein n=1 Tax=Desemzia incerta TaxID=82801 RepID=UPI003D02F402
MEIEVFSKTDNSYNYESVEIIDTFKTLSETLNWFTANEFTLTLPLDKNIVKLIVPDTCLLIDGTYYYVDRATSDGREELMISGSSLAQKADNRIILTNWNQQAKPEKIAYDLINSYVVGGSNPISFLTLSTLSEFSVSSVRYQKSYGNVMEEIATLAETYGFGFVEKPKTFYKPSSMITFSKGKDVSKNVEFSVENENLLDESYENNNFDEATVAYVFGEGEGSARKMVVVNDGIKGINRKEIYVDAKDLQKETDGVIYTDAQYLELLRERGKEKLAEQQKILQLAGSINTRDSLFKYGVDYQLGDRVSVRSSLFNLRYTTQLTSITKIWDETGFYIDPVFGKESPTIFDILRRK